MMIRTFFLAVLSAVCAVAAFAVPVDTTRAEVEFSIVPRVDQFYSPARGFGPVVEVRLTNLGWEGSQLFLSAATMTRHGEYSAFLYTTDPYESRLYAGAGLRYTGTRAYRFFGLGPASQKQNAIEFGARRVEAEARLGWYPVDYLPLTLQPAVRLMHSNLRWFEELEEGNFARLDPVSRESVLRADANPSTGVELEGAAILDFLDNPVYPRSGALFQLVGRRYVGIDDDPFGYWQASATAHGLMLISGRRTSLEGRLLVTTTRSAGGDRPIPFFALPTIGSELVGGYSRYRMVGRDVVVASTGVRFPLLDIFSWGIEGFVGAHLANAYDDVFAQFEPSVSFAKNPDQTGGRAPLRPAMTIGGHIVSLDADRAVLSGQIGFSPEGFEFAGLNFVLDLRTRRPPVR